MEAPKYISHLKQSDRQEWIFQSNAEHEAGVARMAEQFASKIGGKNIGTIMGLLHDLGKEQTGFQKYIRKMSGYDDAIKQAPKTPHAFVGALVAKALYPKLFPLFSYPIASHHSDLKDYVDFEALCKEPIPAEVDWQHLEKLNVVLPEVMRQMKEEDLNHLVRFLFSCLVDADYLDTEAFMNPERNRLRKQQCGIADLLPKLEEYLHHLSAHAPQNDLNRQRESIQHLCQKEAAGAPGFYSLTVPTGGGKTLSSLLWAMHHAVKNRKERIIIAIPYTSIIVQTAATLRRIFGEENVCEHHSTFDPENLRTEDHDSEANLVRQRLATENWDYPIVVTTNVQLFESMYSNKPSRCRKLHNLANSVLILDEVQILPLDYLQPIVDGLKSYQRILGISVLFTTASQPVLKGEHQGTTRKNFYGFSEIKEIIPQDWQLHEKFRRVELRFDSHRSDYDEVAQRLSEQKRVLCIVNTRKDAAELFNRLPKEGRTFHLSRRMCPMHIQKTLETIRALLKDPEEKIIRVVSTQLVEAGVDIDFPVVFRQESGLDSILQAAGRCNREGKLKLGATYVFKLNRPLPSGALSWANAARMDLPDSSDWFSPATMSDYFVHLYAKYENFDKKEIVNLLKTNRLQFETAAQSFKLIENEGINIIVNFENSAEWVSKIENEGFSYELSKKISKFMVNINQQDFKALCQGGFIQEIIEGLYFLPDREQYRADIGLTTENHWLDEILIQ